MSTVLYTGILNFQKFRLSKKYRFLHWQRRCGGDTGAVTRGVTERGVRPRAPPAGRAAGDTGWRRGGCGRALPAQGQGWAWLSRSRPCAWGQKSRDIPNPWRNCPELPLRAEKGVRPSRWSSTRPWRRHGDRSSPRRAAAGPWGLEAAREPGRGAQHRPGDGGRGPAVPPAQGTAASTRGVTTLGHGDVRFWGFFSLFFFF